MMKGGLNMSAFLVNNRPNSCEQKVLGKISERKDVGMRIYKLVKKMLGKYYEGVEIIRFALEDDEVYVRFFYYDIIHMYQDWNVIFLLKRSVLMLGVENIKLELNHLEHLT